MLNFNPPQIAVIGSGHWGKNLIGNYYDLDALGLICDKNVTNLQEVQEQYPYVQTCMAISEVLNCKEVQGVAISTPAETHYPLAREALLAGKHVFVEKPLILEDSQGREIIDLAEQQGLILMVEHLLQYHPVFVKLRELAENSQTIILPFWRGESCLHPDFPDLVGFALDEGMRVHLSTNGHFMNQDFMDIFYRCEFVTFSLHTDKGFSNAKKLIRNKPGWSSTTIQGSFVDTEKSAGKYFQQCTRDPNLEGFDSIRLYQEHTIDGKFGKSSFPKDNSIRNFCPKLKNTLVISADGNFSRCNHIWITEDASNLHNTTLKEVWNGDCLNRIRRNYPDDECTPCDQWSGRTNGQAWHKDSEGRIVHTNYGHNCNSRISG